MSREGAHRPEAEVMCALRDRLADQDREAVEAMFERVVIRLGSFQRGPRIVTVLKAILDAPIYASAPPAMAWSQFIGQLNDELFEDRLLSNDDSLAFWQVLFSESPKTVVARWPVEMPS
jgi:hypothetical protein